MDGAEKHAATVAWFTGNQLEGILQNGTIPDWFHGIITRKFAEDLLIPKPPGYFLIRVSESRIGYTLSYRAQDRCRHFMIDALPDSHYIIVGEAAKHKSLQGLVAYHRRVPILPFNEVITMPCGQASKDMVDYAELILPKSHGVNDATADLHKHPSNALTTVANEDSPPALPQRSREVDKNAIGQNQDVTPTPSTGPPTRIYPCLGTELELGALKVHSAVQSPKPVPLPRKKHCLNNPEVDHPPELPARGVLDHRREQPDTGANGQHNNRATGNWVLPTSQGAHCREPLQSKPQVAKPGVNLGELKKRFQKRRAVSEERIYAEINEAEIGEQPVPFPRLSRTDNKTQKENEYEELPSQSFDTQSASGTSISRIPLTTAQSLPSEYLPPPPFAPGY